MRNLNKKLIIKLSSVILVTVVGMTILSVDLVIIPPLGNLLFPGNGIWTVPGENPSEEQIIHSDLSDDVVVIRDEWGVPHIYASKMTDLTFALGYCHAQDRFFQMDMLRRLVRGKLSELLGESMLSSDKYHLAIGLEYWAEEMLQEFTKMEEAGEIDLMDSAYSYVDGVNYYLDTHKNSLPLEYRLLGVEPVEWTLLDSFCLEKYFAFTLSFNYRDVNRYINYEALGPTYYYELFGDFDPYQKPVVPEYGDTGTSPPGNSIKTSVSNQILTNSLKDLFEAVKTIESERDRIENFEIIGSNNWVVDGSKTTTGKPILCWDPHLSFTIPGIFYESHLVSSDLGINWYGPAPPGSPIPSEGHTQYIAYGSTNCLYDVIDWYYFNTDGDTHYIYNGESVSYTTRDYIIKVKNQESVQFSVRETVHGPVLNDFFYILPDAIDDSNIIISPKWIGHSVTYEPLAYMGWVQAKNKAEFDEASKWFQERPQNVVYADIDGNIAMRPTGKIPIRDESKNPSWHPGKGTFPYNGSNGEGEWISFVPFEDLPNSVNPEQHYLASANQIPVGPDYKTHFLGHPYADGYRARRINELLSNAPYSSISMERMKQIQLDINSTAAKVFTPYLIEAVENYYDLNPPSNINDAITILKEWKYVMDKDEVAPTIYRRWRDYFYDLTFDDECLDINGFWWPRLNILEYLMRENPESHWFDNINTPEKETRDDIIVIALNEALEWLEEFYSSSNSLDWKWGSIHKRYFPHLSGLGSLSRGPYEADGDGSTLNVCGTNIRWGVGISSHGPSYRLIVDLGNLDNTLSVIPSGQRGHSNSKHYTDQLEDLYLQNDYHQQYFSYTLNNFPTSSIESITYFSPGGV